MFLQNGRAQPVTSIPARDVVYSITGRADEVWVGRQRGGLTRLRFRRRIDSQPGLYRGKRNWPKRVPMLFMRAAMGLCGPAC